jgi:two-component system KDP operon response regulator KdpE
VTDSQTILVVDDEPAILRAMRAGLEARGYRVLTATTGQQGIDVAALENPALVVLDLNLPDIDGVEVCRRIRGWTDVPIVVLSAEGSESRKVLALDEGADDFVTKPFSMPELLARIRVALRHRPSRAGAGAGSAPDQAVLEVGDVRVDLARHQVTAGGRAVELTPKEFAFLALLARWPGRVLTHRTILREVWGPDYGTETQYLRVYASQLRKKLDDDPERPRLVTEPGVGYRLVEPVGSAPTAAPAAPAAPAAAPADQEPPAAG